jgi:hypothetical protein
MQLKQLNMHKGQHINKYVVEFQRLASQVCGWGDGALHHQFYNGLPARIKDEISHMGKPTTLSEFKTLAQTIDTRYWECKGEISRETKSSSSNPLKHPHSTVLVPICPDLEITDLDRTSLLNPHSHLPRPLLKLRILIPSWVRMES